MNHLTVAQNIFIGREPRGRLGVFIDERQARTTTPRRSSTACICNLDPRTAVGELTVAKQQMVEIAKALSFDSRVLIMDEPTAALNNAEIDDLFRIIRQLKSARRRHRLHLAQDGRAQRDFRPRHRDARRPVHRHRADRDHQHGDDHRA